MKYKYIGNEPTQQWQNNSGVFSVNEHSKLKKENKIYTDHELEFISKTSFAANVIDIALPSEYKHFKLVGNNIQMVSGVHQLTYKVKFAGESSYNATNYYEDMGYETDELNSSPYTRTVTAQYYGYMGIRAANSSPNAGHFHAWLLGFSTAGIGSTVFWNSSTSYVSSSYITVHSYGAAHWFNSAQITNLEFSSNVGNAVTSGDIILYGVKAPKIDNITVVGY